MQPHYKPLPGFKRCCTCKSVLAVCEFGPNRSRPDGLQPQCFPCKRASGRKYWHDHPEKAKEHYEQNRDAIIARAGAWNRANRERRAEIRQASYRKRIEHRKAYAAKWRERNRGWVKRWIAANTEQYRLIMRNKAGRRRARIRDGKVGNVSLAAILERDGYVCHICGGEVMPDDVHFDHVVPLARGGEHSMTNIKVSHSNCNLRKGSRLIEEMRG